jgi:cytochrome c oxidase subunit 4
MSTDTALTDSQPHDDQPAAGQGGDAHEYGTTDATYIKIAVALMVLTTAEVIASYLDLGPFKVPLLLVMMFIKFFTVVLYFMHLKYDNVLFKRLFYTGLFLAILIYSAVLITFHFFAP